MTANKSRIFGQIWTECHDGKRHLFDLDAPDADDCFTSYCRAQTVSRMHAEDGEWAAEAPHRACDECFRDLDAGGA